MSTMIRRPVVGAILSLTVFAPALAAQTLENFTVEDALSVRNVRMESVSPDGRWLAASIQTHRDRLDVDHFRFGDPTYVAPSLEELVVIDTESGESRPVVDGRVQSSAVAWSPEGDRLAFFLYENEQYRLHLFEPGTGRLTALEPDTELEWAGSGLEWRPDGSGFLAELRETGWRENARSEFLALSEGPVVVQDASDPFLAWDRVRGLGQLTVPALVGLDGSVRRLGDEAVYSGIDQSEDGELVTMTIQNPMKTVYEGNDGSEWTVSVFELDSGESSVLIPTSTDRPRLSFAPSGDRFAYAEEGDILVRSVREEEGERVTPEDRGTLSPTDSTEVRYSVMRWAPNGESLLLGSQLGWHHLDLSDGDLELVLEDGEDEDEEGPRRNVVDWSPDGRYLYVGTSERDRWERGLSRLDLQDGSLEPLVADANLYGSWTLTEDGSGVLFSMSDGDRPGDLYVADPELRGMRRLTEANPWLATRKLTRSELVEYLDVDGKPQKGILYYPVDYEPGRAYPLVAEVYEDFFDNGFNHRMNFIANQGWFGFRPSVEFEEGFPGEAWLKGVTAGINMLIDRGLVDGDKLGVHGTSYGGYAVNLLVTQTDRFAAAINISGKVNIISFLGDSEKITTRNYRAAESGQDRIGATLWEQPQKYLAHSAILYADRIDTPLLLLSGEGDWNVPATNQREMYYALRRLGKEVVWVNYMQAGHGAGRAGTVSDFHDHWSRILGWYRDHFDKAGEEAKVSAGGGAR